MSKKNRVNNDPFNMSIEEAEKTADLINDLVNGNKNITIDDIVGEKVVDSNIHMSSFSQQIEDFINNEIVDTFDKQEFYYSKSDDSDIEVIDLPPVSGEELRKVIDEGKMSTHIVSEVKDTVNIIPKYEYTSDESNEPKVDDMFRKITVGYNILYKNLIIDDGEIPSYINIKDAQSIDPFLEADVDISDIIPDTIDDDALSSIFSEFFYYIITRKVPSLIIPCDAFEKEFGIFKRIDSKYLIFKKNNYVIIYIVDSDVSENFYSLIGYDSDFISIEIVKAMVNVAKMIDKSSTKFSYDNKEILDILMSDSNEFLDSFVAMVSSNAEFAGHQSYSSNENVWQNLRVINYDEFVSSVENKIHGNIIDDESNESLESENDEEDFPELSDIIDEDSILESEPPKIEIEPLKSSTNNQSMVIPVISRNKKK